MIETERLRIYPAARDQMEAIVASQTDPALKAAYAEMLEGCLLQPEKWEWYAMWMIELHDGTHVGEICFKGLDAALAPEIGYGILEDCRGRGYATEAVRAACAWAFRNPAVRAVEAETEADNAPSQRVLEKCGFLATGERGEEGPRFRCARPQTAGASAVLYVHGKGGSAAESLHYRPLFPDSEVVGLAYQSATPREAGREIRAAAQELKDRFESITLIANSIGAFFCMNAGVGALIRKAYFISPIVDMEKLIGDMMLRANVSEAELEARGVIRTAFGEELSWEYLRYVRSHPLDWRVPTQILYGANDSLTSFETISAFADRHNAALTVMEDGEHWFHTQEQMRFLDDWIRKCEADRNKWRE